MFNFKGLFGKPKAPSWESLSDSQRRLVASKLSKSINALAGARYKVVSGSDEDQREKGVVETKNEDHILTAHSRAKLLNLTRNCLRNNPTFNTIIKQFDLHGVGTMGGKAVITFEDKEFAKAVREQFAKWTRSAEFFDSLNFNTLLKLMLKTQLIGGDFVVVFDDGLVMDSGKILLYEPDEIGDTTEIELARHYGVGSYQSQGRVYTRFSQFQGVVVSRSQRGKETFDPDQSYFLKKDPNGDSLDDLWLMPRNVFRVAQGRGITQAASSLAPIIDLESYIGFELAAAKKNAQTLATVTEQAPQEQVSLPSPFPDDADFSQMTDEQIEEAVKLQNEQAQQPTMTLDRIKSAGVIYQVIPANYQLALLDTKHPNMNSIEWTRWLASYSAAPYGLTNCYATLKVDSSYSGYRGEQLMAQPAFEEVQKGLEQICDWVLYRWSKWAVKKGIIEDKFENGWLRKVSWNWPQLKDVDELKQQNAMTLKLKNGTGSYREYFGSDWQEQLLQVGEEIEFCKKNGIPHPALQTVNGSVITLEKETEQT